MELTPIFDCVIGLDIHQGQITACAIVAAPMVGCASNINASARSNAIGRR